MTKTHLSRLPNNNKFWIVSTIGHVIVLLLLIWFTPVREFFPKGKDKKIKPEILTKGEDLVEIIEKIRDVHAERLRERVALLGAGADRMRVNLLNKQGRNTGFESAQKTAVFARIRDRLARARTVQAAMEVAKDSQMETAQPHASSPASRSKQWVSARATSASRSAASGGSPPRYRRTRAF